MNSEKRRHMDVLMDYCRRGKRDLLEEFLSDHPSLLNERDSTDMTLTAPLHVCSASGHYHCVKLLLALNADVHVVDMRGQTPLHLACTKGFLRIIKLLSSRGSDMAMQDYGGKTALHLALASSECTVDIVTYLLQQGSDTVCRDNHEKTPFDIAESRYQMEQSSENSAILQVVEKYLPVYVSGDQLGEDRSAFSIGLGVAFGFMMKKHRRDQKKKQRREEKRIRKEFEHAEKMRTRPEAARRVMFDHMADMKRRQHFRVKRMNYVFPEESELSSISAPDKYCNNDDIPENPENESKDQTSEKKVTSQGRIITKYF